MITVLRNLWKNYQEYQNDREFKKFISQREKQWAQEIRQKEKQQKQRYIHTMQILEIWKIDTRAECRKEKFSWKEVRINVGFFSNLSKNVSNYSIKNWKIKWIYVIIIMEGNFSHKKHKFLILFLYFRYKIII